MVYFTSYCGHMTAIHKTTINMIVNDSVFPQTCKLIRGQRGCDHLVVWFITTGAISVYHH